MQTFCQGGDIGDMIYSLASLKAMGGGHLQLIPNRKSSVMPSHGINPELVERVRPMLEEQSFITGVEYAADSTGINLDKWIDDQQPWSDNIANMCAKAQGVATPILPGWLTCKEPLQIAQVTIVRTPHWHTSDEMWPGIVRRFGQDAVFIGLKAEHEAFVSQFGMVPFKELSFHDMFRAITGSEIFCGNSSAAMALAIGVNVPSIIHENYFMSHFDAPNIVHYEGERAYGPLVDKNLAHLRSRRSRLRASTAVIKRHRAYRP